LKRLIALAALWIALSAPNAYADDRRSGREFMSPALQAMQADDSTNPAFLSVHDGEDLWNTPPKDGGKSCSVCHGAAAQTMAGIAARYPAFDPKMRRVINLDQRVQYCAHAYQNRRMAFESPELLALSAYLAVQSKGFASKSPRWAGFCMFNVRARSTCPAANAMTYMPAIIWPVRRSPRRIRPPIRFIAWNGRPLAVLSAGFVAVLPAFGLKCQPMGPKGWSHWKPISWPAPRA
jgi:hypothetical protein